MTGTVTNWYLELGVPQDATDTQLKAAFRRRARDTHSDLTGGDGSAFAAVARAYEILSDPAARAEHDRELRAAFFTTPAAPTAPADFTGPADASGTPASATNSPADAATPPGRATTPRPARPGSRFATSTPRTGTAGTSTATRPARNGRDRSAPDPSWRPGRWLLLTWLAMVIGNAARFTGIPATVFGFKRGENMLVGGRWWNVPEVDVAADASTIFALLGWGLAVLVIAVPPTLLWAWRWSRRPVPVLESVAALAAAAALGSGWEILLVRASFWHAAGWVVALWVAWVVALSLLPKPSHATQGSFSGWAREMLDAARARLHRPGTDMRPVS